ncbi:PH domain-containing protein [Spirilliplanes yamanashiensis]|uniref:PH domain-containing protein n=1 Tax=Spirilliplanes yamanashiensis TaxID=42233 RepID=UPI001EF28232|nr:PH domain-containing protein [Spirilliplanes yamanashiensis]
MAASPAPPASPASPGSPAGPGEEPRRRLHPLSPLLRGAKSLVVIVAAMSWQTLGSVGLGVFALLVGVLAIGALVVFAVSWLNTGYHVVGRELRIHEGLLWRRTRAIPLERLQSVELVRPLLAQLAGLAELRLEVVGGGKTEAPLAYLSVRDATALRERLLTLARRVGAAPAGAGGEAAAAGDAAPAEAPAWQLHAVSNDDLVLSQLLTPQAMFLPFGVAFVVLQFLLEDTWSFVAIASTLTAMAGVLLQPVRRILSDWNFRAARDGDDRFRLSYGLTETRHQTVPLHRIQNVQLTSPLLWRPKKWLRLRMHIAGAASPGGNDAQRGDRLLPVGDQATARMLLWHAVPGADLAAVHTTPPPPRTRWLHPFAWRSLGAGFADQVFATRSGLLTRELTLVSYARIQSVRVVQGPLQRRLRLATVYADTAGGRSGAARDRDLDEAWRMAAELSARARQAREGLSSPHGAA